MAEPKPKENDFNIELWELGASWKRSVVGAFNQEQTAKYKEFLSKCGSKFYKLKIAGTQIISSLKGFFKGAKKFGANVINGGVELFQLISKGDWGTIGKIWGEVYKNDPLAWLAGSLAGAGIIGVAGAGIGAGVAALGSIPIVATGVAAVGGFTAWIGGGVAALMSSPFVISLTGGSLGTFLGGFVKAAPKIYNFQWQVSDDQYQTAMDTAIENLYEPAGEFLGRASGAFLAGKFSSMGKPPRVQMDITTLALMHQAGDDEIKEEIEDAATDFLNTGVRCFMGIGVTYLYQNFRHLVRSAYNKSPEFGKKFLKSIPSGGETNIGDSIENWGNKGNKGWSIKSEIDLEGKIESIEDKKLKNLLEGFFDNFWDSFSECVEYSSVMKGGAY
ncbi:MAG TPA: hypothetical protein V6D21_13080 [Candidatus Obscuribacterales bacterium]